MSPVNVPSNLPELVRTSFTKAKANGDIHFYPTQAALLRPALTPFQLRYSPALASKPKPAPSSSPEPNKKPFNPFEAPPPALTIAPIGPDHLLVLNKFAVVPEHSLLVTRTFQPQTHLLDPADLAATHACLRAYHDHPTTQGPDGDAELFAFFNSGEHSGASQPHRHLQLLPVARMRDGLPPDGGWTVLADRVAGAPAGPPRPLPFFTAGEPLPPEADAAALHAAYLRLYRLACAAVGAGPVAAGDGGPAQVSYNLAMTRDSLVIMPRTAEGAAVRDQRGRVVGRLALNGTVLAGTALVKAEAEWQALRDDADQLWQILGRIGVDPTTVEDGQMAEEISLAR